MAEKFDLSIILRFINKATPGLTKFSGQMKQVGKQMRDAGKTMSMAVTTPIVAFGANAVRMGADFQSTMNMVGAVTSATGKDFEELKMVARDLGATTQFSARQAGDAMKFLGMAGFDTKTIIGAMPQVLQLAAAAQLDMGSAADVVTNIMAGYGIEAKNLSGANDVLVDTFTNANVTLPELGAAMKKVGPLAKSLKIPFEEVAATLGVLGNAGIKGEEAGTGLKTVLAKLLSPTKAATKVMDFYELSFRKANGEVKSFPGIVGEFENALKKGADQTDLSAAAVEIFGLRGIQIIEALAGQGSASILELSSKLGVKDKDGLGSTARIAQRQMEGLPGAMKLVASAFEAINIALTESEFGKVVNEKLRTFASWLQKIADTEPELLAWGTAIAGMLAATGPLMIGLGLVTTAIGTLLSPIGLGVLATVGVIAAATLIVSKWDKIVAWWDGLMKDMKASWMWLSDAIENSFVMTAFDKVSKLFSEHGQLTPEQKTAPAMDLTNAGGMATAAASFIPKSLTEVVIKVESKDGTTATVEAVKKTGDSKVKVQNKTNVGNTMQDILAFDF